MRERLTRPARRVRIELGTFDHDSRTIATTMASHTIKANGQRRHKLVGELAIFGNFDGEVDDVGGDLETEVGVFVVARDEPLAHQLLVELARPTEFVLMFRLVQLNHLLHHTSSSSPSYPVVVVVVTYKNV